MSNCIFSFANNIVDYKNLISNKVDFIFTNKQYGENCIVLNKSLNLYDCFYYLNNYNKKYNFYLYFSSKGVFKKDVSLFFENNKLYLNYYRDTIYFLKYDYLFCELCKLCESNLDDFVFINFLSNYFSSFNHNINISLFGKFVFPKNKFVYNAFTPRSFTYEKFKNKKN